MKARIKNAVFAFLKEEDGATMVEYGLMVALIAVICMASVKTVGTDLKNLFDNIAGQLNGGGGGGGGGGK